MEASTLSAPVSTPRWSSLSVDEALARLESAQQPSDVRAIFSRCDEEVLQRAWALLSPVQRGALLLARAFRGSFIILDNPDHATESTEPAAPSDDPDQSP